MANKILIVTDDAGESLEIYYAQHRFREAGCAAPIAATTKKLLHGVIHDFEPDWNTYIERPGYRIRSDLTFGQVKVREYAAVPWWQSFVWHYLHITGWLRASRRRERLV